MRATLSFEKSLYNRFIDPIVGDKDVKVINDEDYLKSLTMARAARFQKDSLKVLKRCIIRMINRGVELHEIDFGDVQNVDAVLSDYIESDPYTKEERRRIKNAVNTLANGSLYGLVAELREASAVVRAITEDSLMLEEGVVFLDHIVVENCGEDEPHIAKRSEGIVHRNLTEEAKGYIRSLLKIRDLYKRRAGDKWDNKYNLIVTDALGGILKKDVVRKCDEEFRRLTGIPFLTLDRMKNYKDALNIWEIEEQEENAD